MEYFDNNNGAIHFLFADRDDTYYLKSSVRVPFAVYLRYLLKRNKKTAVLTVRDGEPAAYFARDAASEKFLNGFAERKNNAKFLGKLKSKPSDSAALIESVLKCEERAVVLMEISAFAAILNSRNERNFEVVKNAVKDKNRGKGVLILLSGNDVGDSVWHLKSEKLRELCPELESAFSREAMNPYAELNERMSGQCCFLGTLDKERILPAVIRSFAIGNRGDCVRNIDKVAEFLSGYYSMSFTCDYKANDELKKLCLPDNPKMELSKIDDYLKNNTTSNLLAQYINKKCADGEFDELMSKLKTNAYVHTAYPIYSTAIADKLMLLKSITNDKQSSEDAVAYAKDCETKLISIALRGDLENHKKAINDAFSSLKRKSHKEEKLETLNYILELYYEEEKLFNLVLGLAHYVFIDRSTVKVMDAMRDYMKALSDGVNKRKRKIEEERLRALLGSISAEYIEKPADPEEEIEDWDIEDILETEIEVEFQDHRS